MRTKEQASMYLYWLMNNENLILLL